ncbi:MAG: KH domain-containing protein [Planctomycetota bacterium]
MCEFCVKHGEGKKWYLQASNYSEDLLSDIRRRRFIEEFLTDTKSIERDVKRLEKLEKAPRFVQRMVRRQARPAQEEEGALRAGSPD